MWHVKTDKEIFNEYMNDIIKLNEEINRLENEKKKIQRSIDSREHHRTELKKHAEYYAPKLT